MFVYLFEVLVGVSILALMARSLHRTSRRPTHRTRTVFTQSRCPKDGRVWSSGTSPFHFSKTLSRSIMVQAI